MDVSSTDILVSNWLVFLAKGLVHNLSDYNRHVSYVWALLYNQRGLVDAKIAHSCRCFQSVHDCSHDPISRSY